MYTPQPFDTKQIILSEDLTELTEQIAENVHDVWALGRLKEGWIYGEKEDPEARISPLLVPYADLPESEKDFDRNTAMETLRFIVGHGYTIEKNISDPLKGGNV